MKYALLILGALIIGNYIWHLFFNRIKLPVDDENIEAGRVSVWSTVGRKDE